MHSKLAIALVAVIIKLYEQSVTMTHDACD